MRGTAGRCKPQRKEGSKDTWRSDQSGWHSRRDTVSVLNMQLCTRTRLMLPWYGLGSGQEQSIPSVTNGYGQAAYTPFGPLLTSAGAAVVCTGGMHMHVINALQASLHALKRLALFLPTHTRTAALHQMFPSRTVHHEHSAQKSKPRKNTPPLSRSRHETWAQQRAQGCLAKIARFLQPQPHVTLP